MLFKIVYYSFELIKLKIFENEVVSVYLSVSFHSNNITIINLWFFLIFLCGSSITQGRGCARGALEWGTGKILHLEFDSEWKPIGQNASKFNSQLGVIAKNAQKVPLTYLRWSDMPDDILEYIWTEVKV